MTETVSGVPQGSVLQFRMQILFPFAINDLQTQYGTNSVQHSLQGNTILLLSPMMKLYSIIGLHGVNYVWNILLQNITNRQKRVTSFFVIKCYRL